MRLAAFGAIAIGLVGHALYFNFLNDDAYISFRYADNLVRHGELVFNPGEKVEGYTNFLWTVLMAAVIALDGDPGLWSRVLGIGLAIITCWTITGFISRLRGGTRMSDLLPSVFLAAAPAYACWATGGLETQLFTALTTLAIVSYLDAESRQDSLVLSGIWFALASMTRPEGMLLLAVVGLFHLLRMLFVQKRWRPNGREWRWSFAFIVLFAPYFAWRWSYYGWPFPNTYYVKTGAQGFWAPGARYLLSWVNTHWLWVLPIFWMLALRIANDAIKRFLLLSALITGVIVLHVTRVGGDFMALHRFYVPIMPLVACVAAFGCYAIATHIPMAWKKSAIAVCVVVVFAAAVHIKRVDEFAMSDGSDQGVDRIGWLKKFHKQCTAIGQWLAREAEPDQSIAVTAAGIIPYYSKLYTVDVLGLNDEWVAHNVPARGHRPGHTKSAPLSYVLKKDVDFLIYHPTITEHTPTKRRSERDVWRARGYRWKAIKVDGLTPPWWGTWVKIND
ncbi:MAG: hypothetical protein ACON3Z_07040 [Bradymonadia bacterium]